MRIPIQKALTFRAASVGDCLMGKYLLENVHAQFPEARCGIVIAHHEDLIRDLLKAYPWIEVIEANRKNPRALWKLWKRFHGSDLVVTQYAGKEGGCFALASKIAARLLAKRKGMIGFADASKINGLLYDTIISFSRTAAPASLEREALRAAGVPVAHAWPTLTYVPREATLRKFELAPKEYIVVHLFAGNKSRGLHPDKKRELLVALSKSLPDIRLIISGGKGDRAEALQAADGLDARVIAGETTLQELMNLISESRGVVSLDTGVAHMTAQMGKPLVVLTGCLGRHWWGEGQYTPQTSVSIFSRAELCAAGHIYKDYPDCIGEIAIADVVYTAKTVFS